jgi:hypothetical protein
MTEAMQSGFSDVDETDETQAVEHAKAEAPDSGDKQEGERTFTAEEVNDLIEKRLAREKRRADDEKRKASMNATQRAQADKEEAERNAAERISDANTRVIRSEAKLVALDAGVRPERAKAVLELARAELSGVEVDEFGDPDASAIQAAVDAVIKEYPEFTSEGSKPSWGKAPDASRNTRTQIDTSDPEQVRANFLQSLLGGRQ